MKTSTQVIEFIVGRIGNIYSRPLMFGGTPEGVDLILHYYHELWAEINNKRQQYEVVRRKIYEQQDCGSANFSTRYRMNHPNSSDSEIASYTVIQWKKITKRLGISILNKEKQHKNCG